MEISTRSWILGSAVPWYVLLPFAALAIYFLVHRYLPRGNKRTNSGARIVSLPGLSAEESWSQSPSETIEHAISTLAPDENFQVMTAIGPLLVLRNQYAREAAQHPKMSLSAHLRKMYFPDYPGFEGVRVGLEGHIHDTMREAVAQRLTQALGSLVEDLVDETKFAVHVVFGESAEWTTTEPGTGIRDLVSRITSRVLVGKRMCRSDSWLHISKEYLAYSGRACLSLAAVFSLVRPFGHWFVPDCRRLRELVHGATKEIESELLARNTAREEAMRRGDKRKETCDAITWLCEESNTRGRRLNTPDLVSLQLGLSVAANHTTTEAILHALYHLCEYPDIVPQLREEITKVVGQEGWSKTSFFQLRLMDSFLLESQRHSRGPLTLLRIATEDVVLSSGFVIPKGTQTQVLVRNFDSEVYQDPSAFNPARYVEAREVPGQSNRWQYVTTSPEQMGFGLGRHACPGRFYVANEIKMIFAHLLLKYDWSLDQTYGKAKKASMEGHPVPDYAARLRCKRRIEEIDIDKIAR